MTRVTRLIALATFAIGPFSFQSTAASAEDYVQVGTGVDYSSGDYGNSEDTKILSVPFSLKVKKDAFFVRASIPYLRVKGPGSVVAGDGGPVPGGTAGAVTSNDGIGDLSLSAGYTLDLTDTTYLDMIGRVKFPTASESKNLGTGTTDFTAEAAITHQFGELSLSARGGRRFNGSSTRFPLRDVWQAGAGAYYQAGDIMLGLDYDWREGSLSTASDRSEMTGSVTYKVTPAVRIQGYGYTGFSDGSPNAGGGLQLLYRFAI
jgi:hypothetical protein